tara:strand:+ start:52 stop:753 length:702 start_codon:yes stop_codon:yes gene_type:complete
MANFNSQVSALTGITISDSGTTPDNTELSQFLRDGVIDVTNKIIASRPQDADLFIRKTASDSQGIEIGRAKILTVLREAGADGSSDGSTAWRECRKVSVALQSRVVDKDSIHYASQYHPAYVLDDTGIVNVYPVPSSNNGIEVYYINNSPVDGNGVALNNTHDDVKYFPAEMVYLVVTFAAIRSIEAKIAEINITEEDSELARTLNTHLESLKADYSNSFGKPPQQKQQRGGR